MAMTKSGIETPAQPHGKSLAVPVKSYPGSGKIKMTTSGVVEGPGEALCHGSAKTATT